MRIGLSLLLAVAAASPETAAGSTDAFTAAITRLDAQLERALRNRHGLDALEPERERVLPDHEELAGEETRRGKTVDAVDPMDAGTA